MNRNYTYRTKVAEKVGNIRHHAFDMTDFSFDYDIIFF